MDGIFLIVLAGFAGLCAALLRLCVVLAPRAAAHTGPHGPASDTLPAGSATPGRGQR
ncbi:hypothetical protein [Cupriavidus gilardii]|uniref:hypothetical protein n=1 Tax=Cupriavidus gilardii TaxID=82541 RepID=UPI001EE5D56C|nr:hypothetical protein [Cupriavidus gilardii]MCG5262580.1 hypothetical protein [Cupriavidus gilardii]